MKIAAGHPDVTNLFQWRSRCSADISNKAERIFEDTDKSFIQDVNTDATRFDDIMHSSGPIFLMWYAFLRILSTKGKPRILAWLCEEYASVEQVTG